MGRISVFMLNSIPIAIAVGIVLGFLAGLGIGGGTILILWLTQIIGMDPGISRTINLMFFITAAGSVSLIRLKKKQIPWIRILPAIIAGCISGWIFSSVGRYLDNNIAKKLFGCLLLIAGFRELFYRAK